MVLTTSFPEKDYRGGEIVHHSAPSRDVTKIHLRNTPPKIHHQNTPKIHLRNTPQKIHHQKDKKTQRHKDKKIKRQKLPSRDVTKIHLPEIISMQNDKETVFFLKE